MAIILSQGNKNKSMYAYIFFRHSAKNFSFVFKPVLIFTTILIDKHMSPHYTSELRL